MARRRRHGGAAWRRQKRRPRRVSSRTRVHKGKKLLNGGRQTAEINGADTMTLVVKLARPSHWRAGEDGAVPTFSTRRATITD